MIQDFGVNGASIESVLDIWAPTYRLEYIQYSHRKSPQFGTRPVVACFDLSGMQWKKFSYFFQQNPLGILTSADLGDFPSKTVDLSRKQACPTCITDGLRKCNCGAHAVVLMQDTGGHLKLLNSWGTSFADRGYFRIRDAATLRLTIYDLAPVRTPAEKQAFMLRGCQEVLRMAGLCGDSTPTSRD